MNTAPSVNAVFPADAAPARVTLYSWRHAKRQRGRALAHLVPAVLLLSGILEVASGAEPLGALRLIEFAVGAAYLLLMARELRHLRRHPHHHEPVAWLELAAAGILALEAYHLAHRYHEAELQTGGHKTHVVHWLYAGLAVFYVGLAFGLRHILERRFLHLSAGGFRGRVRTWGREFDYAWAALAAVEPAGPADLTVVGRDGQRRRLSFAHLHDGPARHDQRLAPAQAGLAQS